MKVTVVGAGNVGATCADVIAHKDFVHEVVLLDIKEGIAEGKSLDMWQTSPINLYDTSRAAPTTIPKLPVRTWSSSPRACRVNQA
jgi:malate/lactate dehydrogenase